MVRFFDRTACLGATSNECFMASIAVQLVDQNTDSPHHAGFLVFSDIQ